MLIGEHEPRVVPFESRIEGQMSKKFNLPAAANVWSQSDIQTLQTLVASQRSLAEIAKILRRSESAVRNKAAFHGISLRGLQCVAEST
jgi:hypothetical protein